MKKAIHESTWKELFLFILQFLTYTAMGKIIFVSIRSFNRESSKTYKRKWLPNLTVSFLYTNIINTVIPYKIQNKDQ